MKSEIRLWVEVWLIVWWYLYESVEVDILRHTMIWQRNCTVASSLHSLVNGVAISCAIQCWPESFWIVDFLAVASSVRLDVVSRELANVKLSSLLQIWVIWRQICSLLWAVTIILVFHSVTLCFKHDLWLAHAFFVFLTSHIYWELL